ncbi:MAG: phage baseplate assembly protein [Candidatus Omnitrophica bacterium]|nr:phage baseplate assembly protein [Candidatus Omnitrophota bacterium]
MRIIKCKISSVTDGDYQKIVNGIGRPNEEITERSYFQHVGLTSIPPVDSVGVALIDGNNVSVIATADSQASRPALTNEKDVAIYADADKYVKIVAGGDIEIANNNNSIILKANGDIELGGLSLRKLMTEDIITKYNTHVHVDPVSGQTGPPSVLFLVTDATTKTEAQ